MTTKDPLDSQSEEQSSAEGQSAVGALPAAEAAQKPLKPIELPRGAMLAARKSGGLKFSSHEVVVYPDGRVTYEGGDTSRDVYSRAARKLNDAQIMRMRRLLEHSGFFRMKTPAANQSPDTYAYEIVARVGSKSNQIEVFDGSIPEPLAPLVKQLNVLMPHD